MRNYSVHNSIGKLLNKNAAMTKPCPAGLPPSPIQRLLIVHWNLHELCTSSLLSENASTEERSEEILYYQHNNSSSSTCPSEILLEDEESWNHLGNTTTTSVSSVEEAVEFWGLCKALYTLPEALKSMAADGDGDAQKEEDEDRTQSIYFGDSILVFVPLEEDESPSSVNVLAIVQVGRLYQNGTISDTGSANPLALRASVQRTHRLFCMLRGGGVVHRLINNEGNRRGGHRHQRGSCPYPGMDELYDLHKSIRKTTDAMARGGSSSDHDDEKIQELRKRVQLLQSRLPIRSLRKDLESHYQEYLGHFLEAFLRHGGPGRCLVETMPIPIAHDSGSHTFQSLPCWFVDTKESFRASIRTILRQSLSSSSSLVGIAVFRESQLLFSVSETYDLSCEIVSLLMAHMASYRTRMHHAAAMGTQQLQPRQQRQLASTLLQHEPQPGLLKWWTSHILPMVDEPPNSHVATGDEEHTQSTTIDGGKRGGRFVPSPPTFMLGTYDQTHSIEFGDTNIWTPRVHLPLAEISGVKETDSKCGEDDDEESVVSHHHLAVFEVMGFSFLLFLDLPPLQEDSHEIQRFFGNLEDELSGAAADAFHETTLPPDEFSSRLAEYKKKPGQDIVFLDRSKQRMALLLNPGRGSRSKKPNRSSKPPTNNINTRRFMGFGPKRRVDTATTIGTGGQAPSHRSTTLEWSALGLDCRHLLASRLPLDVCLAFDDTIHETFLQRTNATIVTPFENCTSVPNGWIYAFALDQKEIYVFFDNSIYVTVTDVQSAVLQIKEMFGVLA